MGKVLDFGWEPTADENRFHAMVLTNGQWVRREFTELKVGDIYQTWHGAQPVDPFSGERADHIYCKVTGAARRVKGLTGWGVEIEYGSLTEMMGLPEPDNQTGLGTL